MNFDQSRISPADQEALFRMMQRSGQQPTSGGQAIDPRGGAAQLQPGDKMNPQEAIQQIVKELGAPPQQAPTQQQPGQIQQQPQGAPAANYGRQLVETEEGGLGIKGPSSNPLLKLFGVQKTRGIDPTNYYSTLTARYGQEGMDRLLPLNTPRSPDGTPFVNSTVSDQIHKAMAGAGDGAIKYIPVTLSNEKGDSIGARWNPQGDYEIKSEKTQQWETAPAGTLKGYETRYLTDLVGGGMFKTNPKGANPVGDIGGIGGDKNDPKNALTNLRVAAPALYKDYAAILENSMPDKNMGLKALVEARSSAVQVRALLESNDPSSVGLATLGFYLARMSGSNSQLSDAEREIFQEPLGLIDRLMNKGYKLVAGDLSPVMKADLMKLVTLMEKKSMAQGNRLIAGNRIRARAVVGKNWSKGLDDAFPTMESLSVAADDLQSQDSSASGADNVANRFGF